MGSSPVNWHRLSNSFGAVLGDFPLNNLASFGLSYWGEGQRQLKVTLWFNVTFFYHVAALSLSTHTLALPACQHAFSPPSHRRGEMSRKPSQNHDLHQFVNEDLPYPGPEFHTFPPLRPGSQCLPLRGKTAVAERYYSLIQQARKLSSL